MLRTRGCQTRGIFSSVYRQLGLSESYYDDLAKDAGDRTMSATDHPVISFAASGQGFGIFFLWRDMCRLPLVLNRFPGALLSGGDLFLDDHIWFLQDVANRQDSGKYGSD